MSQNSYDLMPYRTLPQRESNPARLGAIARVLGVDAPSVKACSVLEIGCGTGGNLIPLAARYPKSRFVGFDLSGRQIQEAQMRVEALGLKNITFLKADLHAFSCQRAEFDYILCHGVYSWVPEETQKKILRLMGDALSVNGVAYISYNVLPGWYQRGALRNILAFGSSLVESAEPNARVQKSLEFLELIASSRAGERDVYGSYLHEALKRLKESDPSYIAHEYLEQYNNPCTFKDCMAAAAAVGLQFLSESRPVFSSINDVGERAQAFLTEMGDDLIAREQALDLFRNRSFRETLLCHNQHTLRRDLRASALREVAAIAEYLVANRKVTEASTTGKVVFREVISDREVALPAGIYADVLTAVASFYAAGVRVGGLAERLSASESEVLAAVAMLWSSGFLTLEQETVPAATSLEGVPRVDRVARQQLSRGESIVTVRHQAFSPSTFEIELLKQLEHEKSFADVITKHPNPVVAQATLLAMLERGVFVAGEVEGG